jgi:hypothetical protein
MSNNLMKFSRRRLLAGTTAAALGGFPSIVRTQASLLCREVCGRCRTNMRINAQGIVTLTNSDCLWR